MFIHSLLGKISSLAKDYTQNDFVVPYEMIPNIPFVTTEKDLKPVSVQTGGKASNGFIGSVSLTGDLTRFIPYIDLGSQIQIGENTIYSCGEYNFKLETNGYSRWD